MKILAIGFVAFLMWAFVYSALNCKGEMVTHQAGHQDYTTCDE